jgi:hypothetical protein
MRPLTHPNSSRSVRRFTATLAGLALGALLIWGCDSADETTAPSLSAGEASFAQTKTEVCHRNQDGGYVKIRIADAAYDTHVAHGDLAVGTGGLDADCQPSPTCPCYSADDIDPGTVGGWLGNDSGSTWDLRLVDTSASSLGFATTATQILDDSWNPSHIEYTCGIPLQEDLSQEQGEDCKAIILAYQEFSNW